MARNATVITIYPDGSRGDDHNPGYQSNAICSEAENAAFRQAFFEGALDEGAEGYVEGVTPIVLLDDEDGYEADEDEDYAPGFRRATAGSTPHGGTLWQVTKDWLRGLGYWPRGEDA